VLVRVVVGRDVAGKDELGRYEVLRDKLGSDRNIGKDIKERNVSKMI